MNELKKKISIWNNCWFWGKNVVLQGILTGLNCVIGTVSIVTRDIQDNVIVTSNPAKNNKN